MKKAKYTKFQNEVTKEYFYTITLPSGEVFEKVPKVLGDYLHKQEQLTGKVIGT